MFGIGALFLGALEVIVRKPFSKALHKWLFICWVIWMVEVFMMIGGIGVLLGDAPWGRYVGTEYVPMKTTPLHIWTPDIKVHLEKEEFSYERTINSLGFADVEWNVEKPDSTYRVLCLGDSFTEGYGVSYEESYVAQLRKLWQRKGGKQVEIMNAGVCGSDPFNNYEHYRKVLHNFQPNLIIQTISSHDIRSDIAIRGGLKRFNLIPHNGIYRKPFKLWQVLYVTNYSIRITIDVLLKMQNIIIYHLPASSLKKIDEQIALLFLKYNQDTQKNNTKLFIVFLPGADEIKNKRYYHDMAPIKKSLIEQGIPFIDLFPCYLSMSDNGALIDEFFWKIDRHHNAKGYKLMAKCIYEGLRENYH
jgi:lysophospholipase L1-like esterase